MSKLVEYLRVDPNITCLKHNISDLLWVNSNKKEENKEIINLKSNKYSRKEVFQPHLPVRLPCYDLAPVIGFTLGHSLRLWTLGTPNSHGLTGGVYKARERIHRSMLTCDY